MNPSSLIGLISLRTLLLKVLLLFVILGRKSEPPLLFGFILGAGDE